MDVVVLLQNWTANAKEDRRHNIDAQPSAPASLSKSIPLAASTPSSFARHLNSTGSREYGSAGTTGTTLNTPIGTASKNAENQMVAESNSTRKLFSASPGLAGGPHEASQLFDSQVTMERGALKELKSVRDAASKRIELWSQFRQLYDELSK